jgi:GxxExxY protein
MEFNDSDVTVKIIAAAMKIHRNLGNGFHEKIYQRCLEIELRTLALRLVMKKTEHLL